MKKIVLILCAVLTVSICSFAASDWLDWSIQIGEARKNADNGGHSEANKYAETLLLGVGDRELTNHFAGRILSSPPSYEELEYKAFTVMQNQRLIEQNERIIKLLERQAKKK